MLALFLKLILKGRITIPIRLRAKLRLLEGSKVKLLFENGKLILIPDNGHSSVKASTKVCEIRKPTQTSGSDQKRGDKNTG